MSRPQAKRRYRLRRFRRGIDRELDQIEKLLGKRAGETSDQFLDRQMQQIMMSTRKPLEYPMWFREWYW